MITKPRFYLSLMSLLFVLSFLIAPFTLALTQTDTEILQNLGGAAQRPFGADASGQANITPGQLVGNIIKIVLGFTGTIAFVIFLYGGYLWLTALGEAKQVEDARQYIKNGAIGTVIIILAYSATYYVTDVIFKATAGN